LFASFMNQLTTHMEHLQAQMMVNDIKVSAVQEVFQQQVKSEMDSLRQLVGNQQYSTVPQVSTPNSVPTPVSSSTVTLVLSSTIPSSGVTSNPSLGSTQSPPDIKAQMMLMLMESFTKLTSVMAERSSDTKADWLKFAGDTKKFKTWYLSIVAQILLPPWNEFYDSQSNSVARTTVNQALNGKLYAKLLVALEGQALQDVVSRSHLCANGLLLLQELVQTYKPKNVPEVLAAKAGEFWSQIKRTPHESVDSYYN
jgi:hypothetical protein